MRLAPLYHLRRSLDPPAGACVGAAGTGFGAAALGDGAGAPFASSTGLRCIPHGTATPLKISPQRDNHD